MERQSSIDMLYKVLTVSEVTYYWGVCAKSVMMAIYRDKVDARQTGEDGSVWLITLESVRKKWGEPVRTLHANRKHPRS